MSLIPDEELKKAASLNWAPIVDFLFVVVAIFATMTITHAALYDTQVNLVKIKVPTPSSAAPPQQPFVINIGITQDGKYKWITEVNEFFMESPLSIQQELQKQQQIGLLSTDAEQIKILLHIDKNAQWDPIAQIIFALHEQGFSVHPVYDPTGEKQ